MKKLFLLLMIVQFVVLQTHAQSTTTIPNLPPIPRTTASDSALVPGSYSGTTYKIIGSNFNKGRIDSLMNAVALKANIANPTFTGVVKLNNGADTAATKADVRIGGSGSSFPTQQTHTSGTTVTVTSRTTDIWLIVNPSSALATLTITAPVTPVDGQKLEISFGGTMTTGTVVISLAVTPNTSQTILQASSPTSIQAGETISYRFKSSNSVWYRII